MKLIGFIPGTSEEISKNAAMKKTISTNNENVSDFKNVINYYDFYIKSSWIIQREYVQELYLS